MEVNVQYLDGVQFAAGARGHRVLCDQPRENGGSDSGMTPPEFLLVSLGTCAGFYAAQYLKARGLPAEGLEVKVSAEKAKLPARLGRFRIEVLAPFYKARPSTIYGGSNEIQRNILAKQVLNLPG